MGYGKYGYLAQCWHIIKNRITKLFKKGRKHNGK